MARRTAWHRRRIGIPERSISQEPPLEVSQEAARCLSRSIPLHDLNGETPTIMKTILLATTSALAAVFAAAAPASAQVVPHWYYCVKQLPNAKVEMVYCGPKVQALRGDKGDGISATGSVATSAASAAAASSPAASAGASASSKGDGPATGATAGATASASASASQG